ncbi:PQQ-binding-like beta-propeller repeat protein [Sphingomonas naphthae]|uniref:PQQ-binding-like beta-propeller repeat protein n=1 Tax=Sphingomonas naphthae TaxID=1813468 RepID=A0ABY7TIM6_9SPHN|nr:PQQ-like beta-propeller repeat protein [Sphingomonas naphthae]WCT72831.1 PQQ-binding-like beta-propeller repeat protein [Sphingomonas naphthae]
MKKILLLASLSALAIVAGCGKGTNKPKTAVIGERIPVLSAQQGLDVDPGLIDVPVAGPEAIVNDAWAQPGGNAEKALGHVALPATIARAWSVTIDGDAKGARLVANPVIGEGKLFVVDATATVHAYDAGTGSRLWEHSLATGKEDRNAAFGGGVSYADGKVFATSGLGNVVALDAKTGAETWKVKPGGPMRGAPAIGAGNVYALSQDGQLFALNPANGEQVWSAAATLTQAHVFGSAAPAIAQGTVVAGFASGELSAYRYENGRAVWQDALSPTSISISVSTLSDITASPVIDQGHVYAIGQGGRMVAMDLVSGQRLWELNVGGVSTPWVAGEWVFVVTDQAQVLCIAKGTGKVRWIADLPHYKNESKKTNPIGWYGPVLAGGRLLLTSTDGKLASVGLDKGDILSTVKAGKSFNLGPVVANNTLYLLDNDGKLSAWR